MGLKNMAPGLNQVHAALSSGPCCCLWVSSRPRGSMWGVPDGPACCMWHLLWLFWDCTTCFMLDLVCVLELPEQASLTVWPRSGCHAQHGPGLADQGNMLLMAPAPVHTGSGMKQTHAAAGDVHGVILE